MKQDPLLRLRRKVRATNLQEGHTEYYKLGKTVNFGRGSASGSSQIIHLESPQQLPNARTNVRNNIITSSTVLANEHYLVERLSNTNYESLVY